MELTNLVSYPDPDSHSCGWSPLLGDDVIHPQLWESGSVYKTITSSITISDRKLHAGQPRIQEFVMGGGGGGGGGQSAYDGGSPLTMGGGGGGVQSASYINQFPIRQSHARILILY